jgi:hypothetical protein
VIFLDFLKAFYLVDHSILLQKLRDLWVTGTLFQWISSFISGRLQSLGVVTSLSGRESVVSGVPQVSSLGPLLFLILFADVGEDLKDAKALFLKFLDDSKVVAGVTSKEDVESL